MSVTVVQEANTGGKPALACRFQSSVTLQTGAEQTCSNTSGSKEGHLGRVQVVPEKQKIEGLYRRDQQRVRDVVVDSAVLRGGQRSAASQKQLALDSMMSSGGTGEDNCKETGHRSESWLQAERRHSHHSRVCLAQPGHHQSLLGASSLQQKGAYSAASPEQRLSGSCCQAGRPHCGENGLFVLGASTPAPQWWSEETPTQWSLPDPAAGKAWGE